MKAWVSIVCALLVSSATAAFADGGAVERCRVRVGHERPLGCAALRLPATRTNTQREATQQKPRAPNESWMEALRYPKHWSSKKRSTRLLMHELSRLERLLAVTPKRSPERARIVRRLADGYAELEQLAAVERMRAELNLERTKARGRAGSK